MADTNYRQFGQLNFYLFCAYLCVLALHLVPC